MSPNELRARISHAEEKARQAAYDQLSGKIVLATNPYPIRQHQECLAWRAEFDRILGRQRAAQ